MTKKCPQDGGFIGDAGCTHPNHQHSELVKKVISSSANPSMMSETDATDALTEGFYVSDPSGKRLGFGNRQRPQSCAKRRKGEKGTPSVCRRDSYSSGQERDEPSYDPRKDGLHKGIQGFRNYRHHREGIRRDCKGLHVFPATRREETIKRFAATYRSRPPHRRKLYHT